MTPPFLSETPSPRHRGGRRALVWVLLALAGSVVASVVAVRRERDGTVADIAIVVALGLIAWVVALLPAAWLLHGRIGRALRPELWYDVRVAAWRLHDRWAPPVQDATDAHAEPAGNTLPEPPIALAPPFPGSDAKRVRVVIPAELRAKRPDSLLLNGDVPPLEDDGDVLTTAWAIGAFLDVVQYGVTGVEIPLDTGIATARKDTLDIGVRVAAEIVGTKIPARLRERVEQRQFLVTACVLKHYDPLNADQVREMLTARGHDPIAVWGAADAYLSGYYHCRSWDEARAMAPRMLRLPPPSRH